MFTYFKRRAARQKADAELAEMRIMLDAVLKLVTQGETPEEVALNLARVGNRIRGVLEHRFGWARETYIGSDEDLRAEEKIIDSLSDMELDKLLQRVTAEADKSGKAEEIERTIALRLLDGWITCKLMARKTEDQEVIRQALEHEQLHLDHIRNMMRIVRGERPIV